MKLYDLPTDILSAFEAYEQLIQDAQGEVTPDVEEAEKNLEYIMQSGADKLEACACVIRNLEAEAIELKAEAARLMQRGQSFQQNADRLKSLIGRVLPMYGGKVKTTKFTLWQQKNPTSYELTLPEGDLNRLAEKYPELFKVTIEPSKKTITDLYKSGSELPAGISVTEKPESYSTRIK